jgi:uncharacterized membrane protein YedE/YeeE
MNGNNLKTVSPQARASRSWAWLGAAFGVVGALSIWLWAPIGVSTTYARFIGAVLRRIFPGYAVGNPMLVQVGSFLTPESLLVAGLFIGGWLASRLTRSANPRLELAHSSETGPRSRSLHAFIGGALILFGARMAGGCTSGHIISGIMQLSLSGFLFAAGVFFTGILTAKFMGKRKAR